MDGIEIHGTTFHIQHFNDKGQPGQSSWPYTREQSRDFHSHFWRLKRGRDAAITLVAPLCLP